MSIFKRFSSDFRDPQQVLHRIRAGDEQLIEALYQQFGPEFLTWSNKRYGLDEAIAKDVFQDTIIDFYLRVSKDRSLVLSSSLKTYLFAIGKNKIANLNRLDKHNLSLDRDLVDTGVASQPEVDTAFQKAAEKELVARLLSGLQDPCFSVLKLFYLQSFSLEAIAHALNYKDSDVIKSIKSRCIKQIRAKLKQSSNSITNESESNKP